VLRIACCLWDANEKSKSFSLCYDESWVEKLYRGFRRNLTVPFEFVLFTDNRLRSFSEPVYQELLSARHPDYGCLIEPFKLEGPLIVCGLDTVILGNIDHFAEYCESSDALALPRDPYKPEQSINPIVLAPKGHRAVYQQWNGENDMAWLRRFPWCPIDGLWPGQVLSLKAHDVRRKGTQSARIVYFHGEPKPPSLMHLDWVREHWR
jgi:hypothetical protein